MPKYYILYPSISIYTPCKLLKYPPYTPYNLDIKHLQMHKDYPCRTCRIVVVGNPPQATGGEGGTIWLGGIVVFLLAGGRPVAGEPVAGEPVSRWPVAGEPVSR